MINLTNKQGYTVVGSVVGGLITIKATKEGACNIIARKRVQQQEPTVVVPQTQLEEEEYVWVEHILDVPDFMKHNN